MLPCFFRSPSIPLLFMYIAFLLQFPPIAPFSKHDNARHKIAQQMPEPPTSQLLSPMTTVPMKAELVFSHSTTPNENDLARRIRFMQSLGISSFVIANVDKKDRGTMTHWVECLRKVLSKSTADNHICAQYSIQHQPTPKGGILEKKEDFLRTLKKDYFGADEVLLVSGNHCHEAKAWKTVNAISALSELEPPLPKIAVSYNPHSLDPSDQDHENDRLLSELATGLVSRIYIQFGTDLDRLKTGIEFCQSAVAIMANSTQGSSGDDKSVSLVGSLFLPTQQRITRQKSRPWKGVMLGSEFKNDSSGKQAVSMVSEMVKMFEKHKIELLWEAPGIWDQDEVDTIAKILRVDAAENTGDKITGEGGVPAKNDANAVSEESKLDRIKDLSTHLAQKGNPKRENKIKGERQPEQQHDQSLDNPCLLVFGSHDVRIQDNHALEEALKTHTHVLPVFLYTKEEREGKWGCPQNTAVAVCLEEALKNLQASLESFGLPLVYCNCNTKQHGMDLLLHLINGIDADAIFWNKEATPEGKARHTHWKDVFETQDSPIFCYQGQSSLLYDVDKLELKSGFQHGHFGTLMPFLKKCTKEFGLPPRPTTYLETFRLLEQSFPPVSFSAVLSSAPTSSDGDTIISTDVADLKLVAINGREKWDVPIRKRFLMSERKAHEEMERFVRNGMKKYEKERSRADKTGATSRLSPHLRIGTLSPNQLYWRIEDSGLPYEQLKTISRRLIWRDLAYYHLFCFPDMRNRCIRRHYEEMEWVGGVEEENRRFEAWKKGMTGFPIVDAGMRELYATGWMTQSVRMVVASFLTEYLRVNWTRGCEWFHYTLVDADSAINAMMWQNAGRSGIDQWNFVLSPKTASQDPTGEYTKKWVPELAALPTINLLHRPWEATEEVLNDAGVVLGETYPRRIVNDLNQERQASIENTLAMRRKSQEYNSDRGYDLIDLPNGQKSVVFTKKEYRIDDDGNLLKHENSVKKKTGGRTKVTRNKKRRKAKNTTGSI